MIAHAQIDEGWLTTKSFQPEMKGVSVAKDSSRTITFNAAGEDSCHILNVVTLSIMEENPNNIYFASGFTATVSFSLETKINLQDAPTTESKTLTVTFDTASGSTYNSRAYFLVPDAKQVKITITNVSITGASGWNPLLVLKMDNEMRIRSYYTFSSDPLALAPVFQPTIDKTDALNVSWTVNTPAHSNVSQLEWAWVANEMADYYKENNVTNFARLFADNSSRVDIDPDKTAYDIPLLYDGAGILYYRVREAFRAKKGSNLITGPWSTVQSFPFAGHSDSLNWQRETQFAENGKSKTVMQYFDGTMKPRQTVTKDNETGNTVVAETLYDFQGRPNIQILPTPTIDSAIQYFEDFNRFAGQSFSENPAKYFDLTPDAFKCSAAPPLDITKGNGRYYSPNNDWIGSENKSKYIPDANGYAYSETRYTDDATQRVSVQGGVGIHHQVGSGHETKYFYGKPSQAELDALFGTEAGYADHYFKNMVQDANGQMSVSYVDMHGRTIATALAGASPANLDAINTNHTYYPVAGILKHTLLTPESNIISGNQIESVNTLLVPASTEYNFTYKLDPGILKLFDCNQTQVCYDCKYDLEIVIRPEGCGPEQAIVRQYKNLQLVPSQNACDSSMGFVGEGISTPVKEINFTDTLSTGSWVIRKTLTINDSIFQVRKQEALNALLCKTEENIYDSVLNVLLVETGCGVPDVEAAGCDSCMAHLGTFTQYRNTYLQAVGLLTTDTSLDDEIHKQYSEDSTVCAQACGALSIEFSTLYNLRRRMLSDLIPYSGQYALDTVISKSRAEARFNVMIMRTGHPETPYFRFPKDESGQLHYFTEEGDIDQNIEPGNNPHIILDTISKDQFANEFQYSWANSLIKYHPEYSKLQVAETTLATSYKWLDSVQACDSYSKAHSLGYDLPLTHDPYFVNNYVPADYTTMQRYISVNAGPTSDTTHFSLWRIANGMVLCANRTDQQKTACMYGQSISGISSAATTVQKDAIWQQFRNMYLSYRNNMVLGYINSRPNVIARSTMDSLIDDEKQLIFATTKDLAAQNGWSGWWDNLTDGNHDTTGVTAAIYNDPDSVLRSPCESQRVFWKAELMQCENLQQLLNNALSADSIKVENILNAILDSMVMVCEHSRDVQHPSGASNVNPQWSGTPRSFEDIINHVFGQYGIATTVDSNFFCNPFTISYPKPFDGMNPPLAVNYSNTIDSCGCQRFAALKTKAAALSFDTTSFTSMNLFLNANYHDSLSLALWNGLQRCKTEMGQDTCTNVPGPPGYPVYFLTSQSVMQPNVILPPDDDCPSANIQKVLHYIGNPIGATETLKVNYTTFSATFCDLEVYDAVTGSLVKQMSVPTGFNKNVDVTLPSCKSYNFKLFVTNNYCLEIPSNTVSAFTYCPEACIEPILDSVKTLDTGSVNNIKIWYHAAGIDSLRAVFSDLTSYPYQEYSFNITPNAGTATLSLPGCHPYHVQLISGGVSGSCKDSSQVFYLPGCGTRCDTIYTIRMDTVVAIPSFLSCDYKKPCISCETLDTLVTEFRQRFPGMMAPYTDSIVTLQQADQNQLLTRFLNYRTGFSATAGEYLAAYRSCHSGNPPADAALCLFTKALNDPSGFIEPDTTTCDNAKTIAAFMAHQLFVQMRDSLLADFESRYKAQCLEAKYSETFYVHYQPKEYHYTLYYYAQGGNLLKTLPPAAVMPNYSQAFLDSVATARNAGTAKMNYKNNEAMATQYRYNTLNQVSQQKSPDGGLSKFWYDRLGRLAVSQNEKQGAPSNSPEGGGTLRYSYTLYDYLGRITEVGQAAQGTAMTQTISRDTTALKNWIAAATTEQITGTMYDEKYEPLETIDNGKSVLFQKNLRSRVSYTFVKQLEATTLWDAATFYSYDILGNVDTLLQDYKTGAMANAGNRFKKIVYDFDLISGKVNEVAYQPGAPDAFYHQYYYDAENRITEVKTSKDKIFWERDADYKYYRHGPLARTILGQQQVQGLDYAYTLQGWLKGVNSTAVGDGTWDMGQDGKTTGSIIARDAYGFSLNYFNNDYDPIGNINPFAATTITNELFNGNISAMMVNLPKLGEALKYGYKYDQLNRLTAMDVYKGLNSATNVFTPVGINDYKERVSYDPNGNIKTYLRNGTASGGSPLAMDNLNYRYIPGTNQLDHVDDNVTATNYSIDIDNQDTLNYTYDQIGNLTKDAAEGITNINWNVYGKISSITKSDGTNIQYNYDASGNRISKIVNDQESWYIRDASGNVMSIYAKDVSINSGDLTQTEIHLFGSSRIGVLNLQNNVANPDLNPTRIFAFSRGNKLFELSNHLGNVLATVSDKKVGIESNSDGVIDYYTAEIVSANDYYPFGMMMAGRKYSVANTQYRYGFNGKELDKEVSATTTYDYGFRIYSPGLGKFLSVDPLMKEYPFYTPYQFAGNTPIQFIDLDGAEPKSRTSTNSEVRKLLVFPFEGGYARRLLLIHGPYWATGGDKGYFSTSETESKGYYETNIDANKFIGYTGMINTNSQFYRQDESYSERELVNNLLGDFIWGNGPENTVFKHNGKYSNLMKESEAVGESIAKFSYDLDHGATQEIYQWTNDLRGEVNVNLSSGPLSLAHYVGSCQIRITSFTNSDELMVEIFNVTSLTSGDFFKDITPDFLLAPLAFTLRSGNSNQTQPEYSNQSQYFSFTMTKKEFKQKVKQYKASRDAYENQKKNEE